MAGCAIIKMFMYYTGKDRRVSTALKLFYDFIECFSSLIPYTKKNRDLAASILDYVNGEKNIFFDVNKIAHYFGVDHSTVYRVFNKITWPISVSKSLRLYVKDPRCKIPLMKGLSILCISGRFADHQSQFHERISPERFGHSRNFINQLRIKTSRLQ